MEAMPAQRSDSWGLGGRQRPRRHAQRRLAVHPSRSSRLRRRQAAAAASTRSDAADLPFSSARRVATTKRASQLFCPRGSQDSLDLKYLASLV